METVVLKEIIGQWTRRPERKLSFYKCIFAANDDSFYLQLRWAPIVPSCSCCGARWGRISSPAPGVDMAQPLLSSTGGQCHRKAEWQALLSKLTVAWACTQRVVTPGVCHFYRKILSKLYLIFFSQSSIYCQAQVQVQVPGQVQVRLQVRSQVRSNRSKD